MKKHYFFLRCSTLVSYSQFFTKIDFVKLITTPSPHISTWVDFLNHPSLKLLTFSKLLSTNTAAEFISNYLLPNSVVIFVFSDPKNIQKTCLKSLSSLSTKLRVQCIFMANLKCNYKLLLYNDECRKPHSNLTCCSNFSNFDRFQRFGVLFLRLNYYGEYLFKNEKISMYNIL